MTGFTGTRGLSRLVLRRDRWILPFWVVLPGLAAGNFVVASKELYPTAADQKEYVATTATNPAFLALFGPIHSADVGGIVTQRLGMAPVIVALISALTVIRHTRTEEERGRRELLAATAVGRKAGLAAALTVTMVANVLLAVIIAASVSGRGQDSAGAWALGLSIGSVGIVFAAAAGVAAQLTQTAGAARGLSLTVLGAAFSVRLAGDVGGQGNSAEWLSWLSPIGWAHRLRPFADERWWVLLLPLATAVVLTAIASRLVARRDIGEGVLPPRPGSAEASSGLSGPLGLAWRLHRGPLMGWTAGFLAMGAIFGGVAEGAGDLLRDNEDLSEVFARLGGASGLTDAYLAAMMGLIGLVAAAYGIQAALRLRTEETEQRAEPLLATAVKRLRWASGHLLFALIGPVAGLTAAGLAAGLVHGLNMNDVGGQVPRVLGGALVQLPAVWLLAAVAVAVFGLLPRFTAGVAWVVLSLCVLFGQFGAALKLNQSLLDLSPFTHIPKLPGGDMSATDLIWLFVLTVALVAAGLAGLRRRDLPVP
ncbi:ABC transporter permease [Streptomyces phaeochromogenes]|uniref:ABC transporter permease n=1 Tax=Streptomyces phaeochromogenes TaxID=1923 RepID=UPI003692AFC9